MKINAVEVFPVRIPPAEPSLRWRHGLLGSGQGGQGAVIRLTTDTGLCGVAFAPRPGAFPSLVDLVDRVVRAELIGQDPLQREWLWHRMWELDRTEEIPLPLFGLVDIALWDLAARSVELPLWKLIGGFRTAIPAYASTVTFESVEEYLDVADACIERGYQAIKLHAWGDARADARLVTAVREHVGADIALMFDGSAGFDLPDAQFVGHALADNGYSWYEEPMREFSVSAYRQLAKSVRVPLLVAETSDGAHMNSADFIRAGAATFGVRASTALRGGITGSLRTAHLADSFLLRAEVHGGEPANVHLCMSISNTTYFESLITASHINDDRLVDRNGLVHAPEDVGIALPAGLEVPPELEPYVETKTHTLRTPATHNTQ